MGGDQGRCAAGPRSAAAVQHHHLRRRTRRAGVSDAARGSPGGRSYRGARSWRTASIPRPRRRRWRPAGIDASRPSCASRITSAGSSARREGGRRNAAVSRPPTPPSARGGSGARPLGRDRHRGKDSGGDAGRVDGDAPRLHEGRVIIPRRRGRPATRPAAVRSPGRASVPASPSRVATRSSGARVGDRGRPRMTKRITPSVSTASKPKCRDQRGNRGAGLSSADGIALDRAPEAGDVDPAFRQPGAQAEVPHEGRQRHRAQPSRSASGPAASSPPSVQTSVSAGRTDRAARPRSRRRIPGHGPSGRRRPRHRVVRGLPHQR